MKLFCLIFPICAFAVTHAQTLTIQGGLFDSLEFNGSDGTVLPDGSIVQLGYFPGVPLATSPASFSEADWLTFSPFIGVGSSNAGSRDIFTDFGNGQFDVNVDLDPAVDTLPALPIRVGIRIFDSTTTTTAPGTFYNTFSSPNDRWILENPTTPPTPGLGSADVTILDSTQDQIYFQDSSNRFQTSVQVIPEISSRFFFIMLLGPSLLLNRRRIRRD